MKFLILCLKFKFAWDHKLKMSSHLSQIYLKCPSESNIGPKGLAQFMHIVIYTD